jgi:hypothetical protein
MKGGARPGAGRPAGLRNKRTRELEAAAALVAEQIAEIVPGAFAGDAHALLMWVYKNPSNELPLRVDAAKAAAPYEKPRLSQIDANHSGSIDVRQWLKQLGEPD